MLRQLYTPISSSAYQTYQSSLTFHATNSSLREAYELRFQSAPRTVLPFHLSWRGARTTILHPDYVYAAIYTPDGNQIISASDRTIRIWDANTGASLNVLQDEDSVRCVAISPDERTIMSGLGDGAVCLWDAETGTCTTSSKAHSRWVWAVVFSPDGRYAASGSDDETVILWDLDRTEFHPAHALRGHTFWVTSVVFSHDGSLLFSGSYDKTCTSAKMQKSSTRSCEF